MPPQQHRRLRATTADGAALIDPPLAEISKQFKNKHSELGVGRDSSLPVLTAQARKELVDKATKFTSGYRDVSFVPPLTPWTPLVLCGHQPQLFHSGVWFKNFLLSAIGQRFIAIPISLIVDTDIANRPAIRVPVKSGFQDAVESVAFDSSGDIVPYEERRIQDEWLFESFAQRVLATYETRAVAGHEPYQPLISELWSPESIATGKANGNLGNALVAARHRYEERIGLKTLEVPLSSVVRTTGFRQFTAHLLAKLSRLWRIYNSALEEFRHANHIRSHSHPVPALREIHDWLEAPFFVWSTADPQRRPLFVRQEAKSLVLSDRHDIQLSLDISPDGLADKAVEQLASAESRGIKLRPRALITTMYARLVLSDLFIHGIGGAKYDELTNLIIRRFFGIEPPAYITATATFRLPIDRPNVSFDDVRASERRIRELRYRPESLLRDPLVTQNADLSTKLSALAAEKRDFLDKHDLRRCSQDIYDRLNLLNLAMNDLLTPVEQEMRARHADLIAMAKQSQLLGSREFSFVLHPAEILPARLLALCQNIS